MKSKKKDTSPRKSPTPIRFPDDVKNLLLEQSKKENRSLGNLVITIIKKYYKL